MSGTVSRLTAIAAVLFAGPVGSAADPAILWRTDYAAAMKEAEKKKLPLLVVIGTGACTHCRRMEADTFEDEKVKAAIAGRFVALKLDGNKEPALVQALKVQVYPTCVLSGPDGTIHGYLQGYLDAGEFREHLAKAQASAAKK